MNEGWLSVGNVFHYVRNGRSLCKKWATTRTDFDANARLRLRRMDRDCAGCWKVLGKVPRS